MKGVYSARERELIYTAMAEAYADAADFLDAQLLTSWRQDHLRKTALRHSALAQQARSKQT